MPKKTPLLKGFRIRCEVSGNLIMLEQGLNDRAGRHSDGVFRAVYAGREVAITGELRMSLFL